MGVNGIYGLSGSGMDIESMVKVGMMSKQNEYDKMAQKFTKNEWMKADYLELSSKITTFNSSTLSQYKMSNTMNARSAESSSSAVKVSANSTAPLMSHKVDVGQLSSNAYLISTGTIKRYDDEKSTSIQLKDILFKSFNTDDPDVATKTYTAYTLDRPGSVGGDNQKVSNMRGDATAFSFKIKDGATLEEINGVEKVKEATISFTYEEIANGATLNDLASKINSAGLNIRANFDSVQDQFLLYNKLGGEENTISISVGGNEGDSKNALVAHRFLTELALYQSKDGELVSPSDSSKKFGDTDAKALELKSPGPYSGFSAVKGENGVMIVDGVTYDKITDNKITVAGVTYTALNTTGTLTKDADGKITAFNPTGNTATVSVSQDTDSIMEKVKSFVTDYNKLLADLYAKYDEKPNSDYKPLTQSQKDQMKEDQITKWEEKAKAGLLYHDQTLGKIIQTMRDAVSESVSGINSKYNSIYSLGISTTGIKGQLVLDEDKLKKAMAEDPDAVYNIFAKLESTTTDSGSAVYKTEKDTAGNIIRVTNESNGNGIAQRLGDIFVSANKLIKDRAGSSADITEDSDLNTLLRNLQTKMSNFKKMMNSFEDALYKKYDAMESTLAKLGMQLNYVMGGQS